MLWLCYTQPFTTAATSGLPVDRSQLLGTQLSVKTEPSSLCSYRAGIALTHIPNSQCVRKFLSVIFPGGCWRTASVHHNIRHDAQISLCSLLHADVTSNWMEVRCKGNGNYVRECRAGNVCHYTHVCWWQHLATNEERRSSFVSHKPVSCSKMIRLLWN
jgi:hypothetical protein